MRSRAPDAALAALATMVAAWPLSTLLEQSTWVRSALLLVAAVALGGIGARLLGLRGWQVVAGQLTVLVLTAGGLYGRGHLWHGLPTFDTARILARPHRPGDAPIQSYSAPAPTTRGITVLVGCSLALVALLVDYLAVTRCLPSLAGLPLMATFLGAAANSGGSPTPCSSSRLQCSARDGGQAGVVPAAPVEHDRRHTGTPVRDPADATAVSSYVTVARSLGAVALVLAVALPVALPHLPTRFLGATRAAPRPAVARLGFSQSLNLAADLTNRNTVPALLNLPTLPPSPPPLTLTRRGGGDGSLVRKVRTGTVCGW